MFDLMGAHLRALGRQVSDLAPAAVEPFASAVEAAWRADRTIFIAGNGGSAATASHLAVDLAKTTRGNVSDARAIRAVALTDNLGLITAWANDHSFEHVFAQLGRWRRLSRCYEGSEASARAWLEVASVGYLAWRAVA